jgi:hypothetical protein
MATVSMSGNDTIVINDRTLADLADENTVELTYPNEIASVKTGKNGNSIYGLNESGKNCDVKLRVMRGSSDDQFLNGLLSQQNANFAGWPLMVASFVKKVGDGAGNITNDTYVLSGGIFSKQVEAKSNVAGDTEQSVSIYMMKFSNSPRAIG